MGAVKKKILIVDGDAKLLKSYSATLTKAGFSVSTQTDGNKTIEQIQKDSPDILLLAVDSAQKSGWEVLIDCQCDEALRKLPVILLDSEADSEKEMKAFDAGAMAYIDTSHAPEELMMQKVYSALSLVGK